MICKCSWCGKTLGERPAENYPEDAVTHGICDECCEKVLSKSSKAGEKNEDSDQRKH